MASKPLAEIADFVDVEERCRILGCNIPTGFSILPRNFESAKAKTDLVHEDTAPIVRSLLIEQGIVETRIEQEGDTFPYFEENSLEWIGPTLLIGASVFSQNPHLISITLNVLSDYLTDYFRGRFGEKTAKFSLVIPIPNSSKYVRLKYDGDISGIKEVDKLIKDARRGKRKK